MCLLTFFQSSSQVYPSHSFVKFVSKFLRHFPFVQPGEVQESSVFCSCWSLGRLFFILRTRRHRNCLDVASLQGRRQRQRMSGTGDGRKEEKDKQDDEKGQKGDDRDGRTEEKDE